MKKPKDLAFIEVHDGGHVHYLTHPSKKLFKKMCKETKIPRKRLLVFIGVMLDHEYGLVIDAPKYIKGLKKEK